MSIFSKYVQYGDFIGLYVGKMSQNELYGILMIVVYMFNYIGGIVLLFLVFCLLEFWIDLVDFVKFINKVNMCYVDFVKVEIMGLLVSFGLRK